MEFLTPLGLLFAALAIPILILYMLKLRRREMPVSSTLLWQMVLRDRQANAPWQRIKRNLLLFLQLLILAALVLALARPAIPIPAPASGSVVVLIDASASMQASDVSPTRFQAAIESARDLVDSLTSDARMTLILAGKQPRVLASATSDRVELQRALDSAAPTQGSANWETAFALASGAASAASGQEPASIVIISDGGLPQEGLPPLPGEVRYVPVGEASTNVAISALSLRPSSDGAELFARVTNYSPAAQQAVIY
ncbi:MAG: VWA domain-containing protein [Chloroflexota bacterium]|nr:MAG: VWA domain-containing protein [Chloroflexota bacterium]